MVCVWRPDDPDDNGAHQYDRGWYIMEWSGNTRCQVSAEKPKNRPADGIPHEHETKHTYTNTAADIGLWGIREPNILYRLRSGTMFWDYFKL